MNRMMIARSLVRIAESLAPKQEDLGKLVERFSKQINNTYSGSEKPEETLKKIQNAGPEGKNVYRNIVKNWKELLKTVYNYKPAK